MGGDGDDDDVADVCGVGVGRDVDVGCGVKVGNGTDDSVGAAVGATARATAARMVASKSGVGVGSSASPPVVHATPPATMNRVQQSAKDSVR